MKYVCALAVLLTLVGTGSQAQSAIGAANPAPVTAPPPTAFQIVSNGANFNIWERQEFEVLPGGKVVAHAHRYTELSSGLNYIDPATGQWTPAREIIVPNAQGAIAQFGQIRAIFAANLNTRGALDTEDSQGNRLVSSVAGLMYYDPATGQSCPIAEVQDSEGQIVAGNEVLYTNAFNGSVHASVRFHYRRDGIEQDVILNSRPPVPEAFAPWLHAETAELVVVTEFLNPPDANVSLTPVDSDGDSEPDQAISWGSTTLGRGKAFSLAGKSVPVVVRKQYINVNGRHFLFEKIKYLDIRSSLSTLPQQASNQRGVQGMAMRNLRLPKAPETKQAARPMRLALGGMLDKGYVLDYNTLSAVCTNYTFQGDTTYFISGNVNGSVPSFVVLTG